MFEWSKICFKPSLNKQKTGKLTGNFISLQRALKNQYKKLES